MTAGSTPWLTVVMPIYRGERWIDAALSSLAAEADGGIEVLMIDGSPTSATRDIACRYHDRLDLRILERVDLSTWPAKTNVGVAMARAEHVCWLHHDDLWLKGRAAAVRRWIDAAPGAALHLSPSAIVDAKGAIQGIWRCPFPSEGPVASEMLLERLLVQNFIAAPAPVFRKDAWLACGGLDETLWYTGDWDVWLKLAAEGPVYHHRAVTTGFRVHGQSLTVTGSRDAADFAAQMRMVVDRHAGRLSRPSRSLSRASRASIAVNVALADAAAGKLTGLLPALAEVIGLGPLGFYRYMRDSRIVDRVVPRLRLKLAGGF